MKRLFLLAALLAIVLLPAFAEEKKPEKFIPTTPVTIGVIDVKDETGNAASQVPQITIMLIESIYGAMESKVKRINAIDAVPLDKDKVAELLEKDKLSYLVEVKLLKYSNTSGFFNCNVRIESLLRVFDKNQKEVVNKTVYSLDSYMNMGMSAVIDKRLSNALKPLVADLTKEIISLEKRDSAQAPTPAP